MKPPQDEITMHADYGEDAKPAIPVKVYGWPYDVEVSEDDSRIAYERAQERFWREASTIAHSYGYSGVTADGRSGGWLVPFTQREMSCIEAHEKFFLSPEDGQKFLRVPRFGGSYPQWPGQGGAKGFPRYVDPQVKKERNTFIAFRIEIEGLLTQVFDFIREEARDLTAERNMEQTYRKLAKDQYGEDGHIEFDPNSPVSIVDDGAYVQAWVFVDKEESA